MSEPQQPERTAAEKPPKPRYRGTEARVPPGPEHEDKFIRNDAVTYIGPDAPQQDGTITDRRPNTAQSGMEYTMNTKDGKPFLHNRWIPGHELRHRNLEAEPSASPSLREPSQERRPSAKFGLFGWLKPKQ